MCACGGGGGLCWRGSGGSTTGHRRSLTHPTPPCPIRNTPMSLSPHPVAQPGRTPGPGRQPGRPTLDAETLDSHPRGPPAPTPDLRPAAVFGSARWLDPRHAVQPSFSA
eukprot:366291-Chlamydomonas_euryale.AAC.6